VSSALHRVGQFWRHSSARVSQADLMSASTVLGSRLSPLFLSLPVNEQRHALNVLATVERLGDDDLLLRQAALLHDVGKGQADFSVLDRSLAVFLETVSPGLLRLVLRASPGFAARYQVYKDHAAIGAARLRALGALELAEVIAEHHLPNPSLEATRRLRRADGLN
jgi:putative nucleotidyltransferase with HDIG domain